MKFLFLESFYRGSHALFADGLTAASTHDIELKTLPGDFWKWRMLGAALYFSETAPPLPNYDGLIVSDLFNLADFLAITGAGTRQRPPVLVYFHENQLTYPPPPGDKGAFQTGMINITTALAADRLAFNSAFHRDAFLAAVPGFLQKGRDCRPRKVTAAIRAKATILYPGISVEPIPERKNTIRCPNPPLIIWNHRWSFDKNYPLFFEALKTLREKGIAFRLALLGDSYGRLPAEFEQARDIFGGNLCQFGFVPSRQKYLRWLGKGDIVISTAKQENFGISILEAALCGCVPLLPRRLAYPEILPSAFHETCLYRGPQQLLKKLERLLTDHHLRNDLSQKIPKALTPFLWQHRIADYDRVLTDLVKQQRS